MVRIGSAGVTLNDVILVAREGAEVEVTAEALAEVSSSRTVIDAMAADPTPHYGVSTGFGALANTWIPVHRRTALQESLVRSHAASTGSEVETEVVRALMLLRLATLATGRTGVRAEVVTAYADFLNSGFTPVVGEYGSLGCSGDLAPLAHCALALMGEGDTRSPEGELVPASEALAACGLRPLRLQEKEGLALINGTDGMLGQLVLAIADLERLVTIADIAAAMSVQGLIGLEAVFAHDLQQLRPHPGQAASAANIRLALANSMLLQSRQNREQPKVQDAYSVRCAPQVHGAVRDTIGHARLVAERELAAAVDNPVVTADGRIESNGNFHGAPLGYVLDFLAIAVADLASISERRTDRFLDTSRNRGLNPFLAHDPGVDSGHMIAQYTQAGIVSELKRLATPASVDSIPTSAMQEDHVSMGWSAARKLRRAIDGLSRVVAIELLTAARALQQREVPASPVARSVIRLLRERIPAPGPDRYLAPEIAHAVRLVQDGRLISAARVASPGLT
ncbi:MAG: histidine ammonia-lyase [Propionicimonas sp.]